MNIYLQKFEKETDRIILENQIEISSFSKFIENGELLEKANEFSRKDRKKEDLKEYILLSIV